MYGKRGKRNGFFASSNTGGRPRVMFLPGLGETEAAWRPVIELLPEIEGRTAAVFGVGAETADWSLEAVTQRVAASLERPVHLVGLSLGAIVALNLTCQYPDKVASLFVSAPQAKPPQVLMRVQSALMWVLPAKTVCPPGVSKAELLAVLRTVANLDLTAGLGNIAVPTTVACGAKDWANLAAARDIAAAIPGARLVIVPGARHQWHQDNPGCFAAGLKRHLAL
ncbi:branched-chain alpha-keto acid dehydrogenase subunit E2 domain protein [Mobiluncus mulieris 28-1]|nr:branched-chain alpha-keto acid dehydrogenase subunit E2 domain protein [Mobiluncus mulieris 28-1]